MVGKRKATKTKAAETKTAKKQKVIISDPEAYGDDESVAKIIASQKETKTRSATKTDLATKSDKTFSTPYAWEDVGECKGLAAMFCFYDKSAPGRSKVIGFDLDFTLVKPKSGAKFAKDDYSLLDVLGSDDWMWLYDFVPKKLKQLHVDGFRICIFSNQGGIEKNIVTVKEIMTKTQKLMDALQIPFFAFYCTGENHYRKPSTQMWDYFVETCNGNVKINMTESMYVGDAAGRAKNWAPGKPKDFSCTDRMFAANVGLNFRTPEEFFMNEKPAPFEWNSLNVETFLANNKVPAKQQQAYHCKHKEVVLLVGMPASGKSSFCQRYLISHGYVHISRDTLITPAKCLKAAEDALKNGKSIAVDNTNPSVSARSEYLKLAKNYGYPCRCIVLDTPKEMAHHLNYVRQTMTNGQCRRIPDVGYHVYAKNFQEPTTAEGFTEILHVPFVPVFDEERHERLFKQWTA